MRLPRFWPQSITAQITVIVAVSVLLGIALTFAALLLLYGRTGVRSGPSAAAAWIASVAQMAHAARKPAELETIIAAAQRRGIAVKRVALSDVHASLGLARPPQLLHALACEVETGWGFVEPGSRMAVTYDGETALLFELEPRVHVWRLIVVPLALALTIVSIVAGFLSVYAVHSIISPLSTVAAAALSFGRAPADDRAFLARGPSEIVKVADALNEMRTRMRALLDDRTRMLAAISHDLRTPLTRLRLRVERIAPESRDGMLREIERIGRMLDETLEHLRLDLRPERTECTDLASLVQTICTEFTDVGHAVSYEGPLHLAWTCRPSSLARAITNVIDNSTKHGTFVTVALHVGGDAAYVDVCDDGPGIPAALQEKIFEPFFRIDTPAAPAERVGFGLGLAIARDVVTGHGGTIELRNRSSGGLRARVSLPKIVAVRQQPQTVRSVS